MHSPQTDTHEALLAVFQYGSLIEMQRPVTQQHLISHLLLDEMLSLSDAIVPHILSITVRHYSP